MSFLPVMIAKAGTIFQHVCLHVCVAKQELSYRQQIVRQLRTQYAMTSIGTNITP